MAEALLDSNVLVAAVTQTHIHHTPSAALFPRGSAGRFAVAAHGVSEAFNTLTRQRGPAPIALPPADAWRALDQLAALTIVVGLTPQQTLATIRRYAETGGVGARLYDHLIAETAVRAGLRRMVTWNVGHMRGLAPPGLEVVTPEGVG